SSLIANIERAKYINLAFKEKTNSPHKSLIAIPLKDHHGHIFGVLRCINKEQNARIMHVFVKGDSEFLQIVTGILSGYIKQVEFYEKRVEAMKHFAHESRQPMQTMWYELGIIGHVANRLKINSVDFNNSFLGIKNDMTIMLTNVKNSERMFLGSSEFKLSPVDIQKMLASILESFNYASNPIKSSLESCPKLRVFQQGLHQVFVNLLVNAQRYSNRGSEIRVLYKEHLHFPYEGWHRFDIINMGIGVDEDAKDKIFDIPFFRTEAA